MRSIKGNRRFISMLSLAVGGLLWSAGFSVSAAITPLLMATAQQSSPPPVMAANFAGDDTCITCHEGEGKTLSGSKHGKSANARTPAAATNQACETCHGPGREHAESGDKSKIRVFPSLAPRDSSAVCLTCHNRGDHAGWEASTHESRNLTCTTCHSVHNAQSFERQLVKATETELCATCHRLQVVKTERAVAHMPIREGKMSCSSCHNPHGSIANVKALKVGNSVNESCTSCHAEMRGPMLFEHAPVRENCTTCHDPHGSSNDRMLNVRMPMLCQRCHVATKHPSSVYDNAAITTNKSNRMFGRSCVNCHSNIHGSNHPSGQFFMR
jgi:DmsE family decaheme c-type cytochrome